MFRYAELIISQVGGYIHLMWMKHIVYPIYLKSYIGSNLEGMVTFKSLIISDNVDNGDDDDAERDNDDGCFVSPLFNSFLF